MLKNEDFKTFVRKHIRSYCTLSLNRLDIPAKTVRDQKIVIRDVTYKNGTNWKLINCSGRLALNYGHLFTFQSGKEGEKWPRQQMGKYKCTHILYIYYLT